MKGENKPRIVKSFEGLLMGLGIILISIIIPVVIEGCNPQHFQSDFLISASWTILAFVVIFLMGLRSEHHAK